DRARGLDAGEGPHPLEELLEERGASRPDLFGAADRRDERQDAARIEAGVDGAERAEGADHEPGTDEEDEREGELRDHEEAARAPSLRRAVAALLEGGVEIGRRGLERRRQPEADAGQERDAEHDGEHAAVERDAGEARQVLRPQPDEELDAEAREEEPGDAAE